MLPLTILLLLLFQLYAQSQPPTPTPGKPGQEKQQRATGKDTTGDENKGISPVTVTVVNAPVSQDSTKHEEDPSSTDWWMRIFTGTIAAATIAQWYIYWRQKGLMANALSETTRAATAAGASAEHARTAIVLSQRPKLTVHNMTIRKDGQPITPPEHATLFYNDICFQVTNVGGVTGTIVRWHVEAYMGSTLPMDCPYEGSLLPQVVSIQIPSGTATALAAPQTTEIGAGERVSIADGRIKFWIMGFVQYTDELKNFRTTRFCRQWNRTESKFYAVNDPDYEDAQ